MVSHLGSAEPAANYNRHWVRLPTVFGNVHSVFDQEFTFGVTEPSAVMTVAVFDDISDRLIGSEPRFLGLLRIRPCCPGPKAHGWGREGWLGGGALPRGPALRQEPDTRPCSARWAASTHNEREMAAMDRMDRFGPEQKRSWTPGGQFRLDVWMFHTGRKVTHALWSFVFLFTKWFRACGGEWGFLHLPRS